MRMIYLVRHGQTNWNLERRFNGVTETELNSNGFLQVEEMAKKLKDVNIDICFSSPQKRARQASDILCIGDYIVDQRLTEIDCGEFEGLKETPEAFKELWLASIDGSRGVENFEDFKLRNCNFL